MKKLYFLLMLFVTLFAFSCSYTPEQKETEKQMLNEMNKSMQESANDLSIDTTSTDSTLLK
ncbi:MAG: hypothetical protein COS14_04390 [Bacteroidetes bacterium CG02_land_8_20_14_3_00_31_25]|nr:hypothetical protein [Bacteroidota bacterium]PIV61093.1 MAG: hypothetical protein COS14_04390 [Bacteroidetes bacterium CG02_land_8_20_14_3_00_31_25]PIX33271.1 MAG: hypothetical protein COZ59_09625 [Bacteroidetes bacterium CG_4_8_14_3_um_filter_31_14]PIY07237.1 MAG: hypothetical protein COZ21_01300 [Bacteroidetes bacterium CG_4_10_14_3_um_filter_31_20]